MGERLTRLIDSLDEKQRNIFREYAGKKRPKPKRAILWLFEALANRSTENAILDFSNCKYKTITNDLAAASYQLENDLLKTLSQDEKSRVPTSAVEIEFGGVEFLFNKGLFDHCYRKVKSLKKKALGLEEWECLIKILDLESQLIIARPTKKAAELSLEIANLKGLILSNFSLEQRQRADYWAVLTITKSRRGDIDSEIYAQLETMKKRQKTLGNTIQKGRISTFLQETILGMIALFEGRYDTAFNKLQIALNLLKEIPGYNFRHPGFYRVVSTNLLNVCLVQRNWDDFLKYLVMTRGLEMVHGIDKIRLQQISFYLELLYCLNSASFTRAKDLPLEILRWSEVNSREYDSELLLNMFYNSMLLYLLSGDNPSARKFLYLILNFENKAVRMDLVETAKLFELIIHWELGHYDLIETYCRNLKRKFTTIQKKEQWRRLVIDLFLDLLETPPTWDRKKVLDHFRDQFAAVLRSFNGAVPIGLREIFIWLDAKSYGIPIREFYTKVIIQNSE